MADKIRVLIADDHPIVRRGLGIVMAAEADIELVGEAADGSEAVRLVAQTQPDVIIMDLMMPVKDGLSAIVDIQQVYPHIPILVLTSFVEDTLVFTAIKAGAVGFLLKDAPPEDLLAAIRAVQRGDSALHPAVARKLLHEFRQSTLSPADRLAPASPAAPTPLDQDQPFCPTTGGLDALTPREMEVLELLAQGYTNRDLADRLHVTLHTVATHVRNILDKLHLANRTQAALYARNLGMG